MATPLTADRLLAALRAEGCTVREYRSWRTHERDDETGRAFGPVNGIVIHHTAGRDSLALCYSGTSALPGPLCHSHLAKTGQISMISAGRANHAGGFAQNAHDAVVNEAATHPYPDRAEPVDGNDHYYGIEIENLGDGRDPYPSVQYEQAVRWASAICRAHGWSEHSVIGHKEGTRRKIDPSFSMAKFRADVAARLKIAPGGDVPIVIPKEEDMPLTAADAKTLLTTDGIIANGGPDAETNPKLTAAQVLNRLEVLARRTEKKVDVLSAANAELVKTVGVLAAGLGDLDPAAVVAELRAALEAIDIRIDVPDSPAS